MEPQAVAGLNGRGVTPVVVIDRFVRPAQDEFGRKWRLDHHADHDAVAAVVGGNLLLTLRVEFHQAAQRLWKKTEHSQCRQDNAVEPAR